MSSLLECSLMLLVLWFPHPGMFNSCDFTDIFSSLGGALSIPSTSFWLSIFSHSSSYVPPTPRKWDSILGEILTPPLRTNLTISGCWFPLCKKKTILCSIHPSQPPCKDWPASSFMVLGTNHIPWVITEAVPHHAHFLLPWACLHWACVIPAIIPPACKPLEGWTCVITSSPHSSYRAPDTHQVLCEHFITVFIHSTNNFWTMPGFKNHARLQDTVVSGRDNHSYFHGT